MTSPHFRAHDAFRGFSPKMSPSRLREINSLAALLAGCPEAADATFGLRIRYRAATALASVGRLTSSDRNVVNVE